jgi:uncharacterized protein YprB with RNaseH-like and TPR domain
MSSLIDRLRALGVPTESPEGEGSPHRSPHPIKQVVAGTDLQTPHGPTFLVTQRHPVGLRHGCSALSPPSSLGLIAAWAGEPALVDCSPEALAYVDAETTGLARAAGTYAFLVGVGRYVGGALETTQFFMRDPAEEPALLHALHDALAPCRALVTFNGKTFDLPLLRSRFVANRQEAPFVDLPHLDLLSLARRMWRTRLPSRALSCLEADVLGVARPSEDVSGWLIPALYFDYMRDGDARPLRGVLQHNQIDILSMAALLSHAVALTADPLAPGVHPADRLDLGRMYEDLDQNETAARLYEQALGGDLPGKACQQARQRWALLEKRRDNLSVALRLWEEAAQEGEIYAHVELAKAYEHRLADYERAIHWTQRALDHLGAPDRPRAEREMWLPDLAHRLARLKRKAPPQGP